MLGTIYHIGYLTDDMEKAIAFYQETFDGQIIVRGKPSADGTSIVYMRVGESELELIEPGDRSRMGGRTGLIIDHVGYFVDDLDSAMVDLQKRGVAFASAEPTVNPVGYRMIYLQTAGTLGTRIHLTERSRE